MKKTDGITVRIRYVFTALLFGLITGFLVSAGRVLDRTDSIELLNGSLWLSVILYGLLFSVLVFGLWILWDFIAGKKDALLKGKSIPFPVRMSIMFLAWIPYWLSIYPGAFSYDAYDEWKMVADGIYTTHHPLIHTLFLGGLTEGFYKLSGNYNTGIAVYTVIQMLLLSAAFSYIIERLHRLYPSPVMQIVALVYFSLSPVIGLFSISSTKDPLFCAFEMLFFLFIYEFFSDRDKFLSDNKNLIGMAVFGLLTMMFRKNGVHIALLSIFLVLVLSLKYIKKYYKTFLLLLVVMFLPYFLYAGPFTAAFHAEKGKPQEMLSVPLQQMARVYTYNRDQMSEDEIRLLTEYVPKENLENYLPTLADRVKSDFNNEYYRQNPLQFYRLWLGLGMKNPMTYICSFLINTVDGWYPGAVIDGYRFEKSSYFDYRVAEPGSEKILLPALHSKLDWISHDATAQSGVLFMLLFSPGWYLLCFLCFWMYAFSRKKNAFFAAGMVHVFHYLTVLLGPMALVRYELNFFYGIPVFIWCLMAERQETSDEGKKS